MASQLTVNRGTTYTLTHIYNKDGSPSTDGALLFFTVKPTESDLDDTDAAALVEKNVEMDSATTTILINPVDTQNIPPGNYWYDVKIKETSGAIYRGDKGRFTIDASPTNRLTSI